jgi:hypothetical protein
METGSSASESNTTLATAMEGLAKSSEPTLLDAVLLHLQATQAIALRVEQLEKELASLREVVCYRTDQ